MKYSKGYKYQLEEDVHVKTKILGYSVEHKFFTLSPNGWLVIHAGYAWDGASGPTIDSNSSMLAALVHDVLYQMLRMEFLPAFEKESIDSEFRRLLIVGGMWTFRANMWYMGVSKCADFAADPKNKRKIYTA